MEPGIDRRRDPRAPLALPVSVKTPQGVIINGQTANISVSGLALLLFLEKLDIGDEFEITIKMPDGHKIPVTCEKIWVGNIVASETVYTAIGVQFIKISPSDNKIIASMVKEYHM